MIIKRLNELNLTEEQNAVFTKARKWAFGCHMGRGGITYEIEQNILKFLNESANIDCNIIQYFPDFYNGDDKIKMEGDEQ